MRIIFFLLFSFMSATVSAFSDNPFIDGCTPPDDLNNYDRLSGNYVLDGGSATYSNGLYVRGDVTISGNAVFTGNIYATGDISVSWFSTVTGSVFAEGSSSISFTSNVTGDNCVGTEVVSTYCDNPPDINNYTIHGGNLTVDKNTTKPNSGREDLYVTGSVNLNVNGEYNGNIYAVGDVYLDNNAVINGDVYTQDGIVYRNVNSDITGETCENGEPVGIPLALPVDELSEVCSDIFYDAAQSYSSSGELTMWGSSTIDDDTDTFDFATHNEWGNPNGCGSGTLCTSTGEQSTQLSDFDVPVISGLESIVVTPDTNWGDGNDILLGDPLSDTDKFKGVYFGDITVHGGGILTFAPQPAGHIYRINRLNIYNDGIVKLNAGTYAFNGLGLIGDSAQIEVLNDGDVYLFVNKTDSVQGRLKNEGSGRLVFSTNESLDINGNNQLNVDIYAGGTLRLDNTTNVSGRIAATNLTMGSNATIINDQICGPIMPPADEYKIVIITSSDALTCEPHRVEIQVQLDGNTASEYTGAINLSTSTNRGTWSIISASDNLSDSGNNDGQASFTFTKADAGKIVLGLFNETTDALNITVTSDEDSVSSDLVTYRPFLFRSQLPAENTANSPFSLTLEAVGKDDTTDTCKIIEEYTGNKQLKFWSSYIDPDASSAAGTFVEINGDKLDKPALDAVDQTISFTDGEATILVNYPDAGRIQIHARDDQGIGSPPDGTTDELLQGSAITVVKPAFLFIEKITGNDADATDYNPKTGAKFKRASVPNYSVSPIDVDTFKLTVKALIDCSDDPLSHCSGDPDNPTITPSFSSNITLIPSLIFPKPESGSLGTLHATPHSDPVLNPDPLKQEITNGTLTYADLAYDEVGVVGITAKSDMYLGTEAIVSEIKDVGRFYPDYISYQDYSYDAGCGNFTYMMAENSTTLLADSTSTVKISYTLVAQAQVSAGEALKETINYSESSGYPVPINDASNQHFNDFAYAEDLTDLRERLLPESYYNHENWIAGTYKVDALQMGLQKSNQADGPYFNSVNNQLEYFIQLTGFDGEKLKIDAQTPCSNDKCLLTDLELGKIASFGDFAYGRLLAGHVHGSEFQALRTKVEATYFDGSNFVSFADDNCTAIIEDQTDMVKDPVALNSDLSVVNSPNAFVNGFSYFEFSAPAVPGKLDYFIQLDNNSDPALDIPWLLDSGNAVSCAGAAETVKECIKGYVEFGLFRGNDRIIYRRQNFQ